MQPVKRLAVTIAGLIGLVCPAATVQAQRPNETTVVALQRILVAEDARGTGASGVAPLLDGLLSEDTLLRRVAIRGVGRLQRPDLARLLLPFLEDAVPAIRAEAANAIAQGLQRVRRVAVPADTSQLGAKVAQDAFVAALAREQAGLVIDALAEALGRLPFADSSAARAAERAMRAPTSDIPSLGIVHGMYSLVLARRFTGGLSTEGIALLRRGAVRSAAPAVRRLAVLTLGLLDGLDSATTLAASRDGDEQVRRLSLTGARSLDNSARQLLVRRALADSSVIVRVEAIGAARRLARIPNCAPLVAATHDPHPYVALVAIDSLGAPCTDSAAVRAALAGIVGERSLRGGDHSWQRPTRALLALSRIDAAGARSRVPQFASSARWQDRAIAARVATSLNDDAQLLKLAGDRDQNVREAAIVGLATTSKHTSDSVYIAALAAPGFQVVLAAAEALAGSTSADALPALLDALDRLTAGRSENARDPRLAILRRISALGGGTTVVRMMPYLTDFDTTVAATAAGLISGWSGRTVVPAPRPLPIAVEPLAEIFATTRLRLRVTLAASSGGGTFTLALFPTEAPATVARLIRRAREHYFDGTTFQRVEPNFVVQGGGHGATEYVGDRFFMRDELTPRSHGRGTVGISARGRDTGDAQLFINLVDNPRLDHEYTVFGEIVAGRAVAERLMEGDMLVRVEVLRAP